MLRTIRFSSLRFLAYRKQKDDLHIKLLKKARVYWKSLAKQQLSTTAKEYIQGIGPVEQTETTATIRLSGFLPVHLEKGLKKFDMKPGILKSSKAKISKKGTRFVVVPIKQVKFKRGRPRTVYRRVTKTGKRMSPVWVQRMQPGRRKVIFRVVSTMSKASSWKHPGIKARKLVPQVKRYLYKLLRENKKRD